MDWFVKAFIKSSVTWLAFGVTFGLAMAAHPAWTIYRPAHLHMLLLGFVTMMIYGVAYHVIPRFVGFPLHSRRAAGWHWWMSNIGLVLMVVGFVMRVSDSIARSNAGTLFLTVGGTLAALGAYIFAYVLWRTMDGPKKRLVARPATPAVRRASLPLAEAGQPGSSSQQARGNG
ncbi:MAG TPA: cbb3-type cytochrome c oxidase subunit I [Gemmatimonadaceae bacterium]